MNFADPGVRAASLVRLRWGAALAEVFSLLVAHYTFDAEVPVGAVVSLVALMIATNVALAAVVSRRAVPAPAVAGVLAFDMLHLTALLALAGGSSNPFSVLYLVLISLAALMLGPRWTWGLALFAASAYAALFWLVPHPPMDHSGEGFASHLRAMWIAFTAAAGLIAYFVVRLASEVERRDHELEEVRERAGRHERLASLTTLAAGAAHELGTPLSTVAVVAKELERGMEGRPGPEWASMREDVALIRREMDRCRHIINGMAARSGDMEGELPRPLGRSEIVALVRRELSAEEASRVDLPLDDGPAPPVFAPPRALVGAVLNLIRNGLDASPPGGRVSLALGVTGTSGTSVVVSDVGTGMRPDVLARASDPFFTTKPPGSGLGLGLFLARTLAERLGGRFEITSTPGAGTAVRLELPPAPVAAAGAADVV
ncbi:MAG: sensor histidine kinase [Acidobacteria bacterium]|nr:MAG: sensor histidine kinase [Acidobacteriota bacterium]